VAGPEFGGESGKAKCLHWLTLDVLMEKVREAKVSRGKWLVLVDPGC
jgi:hypothetical protein